VLASRPDVDTSPDDYNTVFEIAVGAEHIIITSIASEPSEIDNSSGEDRVRSPHHDDPDIKLARTMLDKDVAAVTTLGNEHQLPNLRNDTERLPLLEAANTSNIDLLSERIEDGAYMEYQDEWGESLLALTSRGGHAETVLPSPERRPDKLKIFVWVDSITSSGKGKDMPISCVFF
jgi:ankyrin repeat protein